MDTPGRQTVGVVVNSPVLDAGGDLVYSEIMGALTSETVHQVDGCLFEIQDSSPSAAESQSDTTTTNATAWCLMPATPLTMGITSQMAIRYPLSGGHDYQMRGDARIEYDLDGIPDHVFCLCERQEG